MYIKFIRLLTAARQASFRCLVGCGRFDAMGQVKDERFYSGCQSNVPLQTVVCRLARFPFARLYQRTSWCLV